MEATRCIESLINEKKNKIKTKKIRKAYLKINKRKKEIV
jgi:hypothetical protein